MTQLLEKAGLPDRVVQIIQHNIVAITLLLCSAAITLGAFALARQSTSVYEACKIQQHYLPANHHLERFFVYYSELIGLDSRKVQRQLAHEPKRTRDLTYGVIHEINAYAAIVKKSPTTRKCP